MVLAVQFIPKKRNGLNCHSWCLSWWNNWVVCFHKFVDNSQEKKKLEDLLKELVRMTAQSEKIKLLICNSAVNACRWWTKCWLPVHGLPPWTTRIDYLLSNFTSSYFMYLALQWIQKVVTMGSPWTGGQYFVHPHQCGWVQRFWETVCSPTPPLIQH